ncbi:hypothetical protein LJK88_50650 [Paenibacillus sp. P26]|nr:hypothetical protein LJK88_50650 [Paenibacillus sp. P26]UUZ91351.1 hypothetical protein LJK87_37730 [Paenibacillus sp. P25]
MFFIEPLEIFRKKLGKIIEIRVHLPLELLLVGVSHFVDNVVIFLYRLLIRLVLVGRPRCPSGGR